MVHAMACLLSEEARCTQRMAKPRPMYLVPDAQTIITPHRRLRVRSAQKKKWAAIGVPSE